MCHNHSTGWVWAGGLGVPRTEVTLVAGQMSLVGSSGAPGSPHHPGMIGLSDSDNQLSRTRNIFINYDLMFCHREVKCLSVVL